MFDKNVWIEGILADTSLIPSAKIAAMRLAIHHNSKTGQCNPTLPTLARGIGMSSRTTHTALTALRDAGYISWIAQKDGRSSYTLKRITIGQVPVKVPAKTAEPLRPAAIPLAADCKGEACSPPQTNSGSLNPGKNSVSSDTQEGTGTQRVATQSGQEKVAGTFATIPDDFKLTPERRRVAMKAGITSTPDIQKAFSHFRAFHEGKGTRSPKWESKWLDWCMNRPNKTPQVKRSAI